MHCGPLARAAETACVPSFVCTERMEQMELLPEFTYPQDDDCLATACMCREDEDTSDRPSVTRVKLTAFVRCAIEIVINRRARRAG